MKLWAQDVLARTPNHPAALYDLGLLRADFLEQRSEARVLFERYLDVAGDGKEREVAEGYLRDLSDGAAAKPAAAGAAP